MIPAAFGYQRPSSLDEALRVLASNGGAKVLAGGHSLLPLLKLRLGAAETLIDIGRLAELKGVRQLSDGRLAIGALTTYRELMESPARHYGVLGDALPGIGDVQVRNRGTVGGAIAHADPAPGPCRPVSWRWTRRSSHARRAPSAPSRSTASSRARS